MLLMTMSALLWMVWKFFFAKPDFLLGTVSAILIILAIMMVIEGVKKIRISRS